MKYYCVFCKIVLKGSQRKYCSNSCKCKYFHQQNPDKFKRQNPNKFCIVCGKNCWRKKYCSDECKLFSYYFNDEAYWKKFNKVKNIFRKRRDKERHRRWVEKNKENYTLKNKSRMLTLKMFNKNQISLDDTCSECGTNLKLEIHHEIYPTSREDIKNAVVKKNIYLLCKFCHANVDKE